MLTAKRRNRDNIGSLLDVVGHFRNRDVEKAETLCLSLTPWCALGSLEPSDRRPWLGWGCDTVPADSEHVGDLPFQLGACKSMSRDAIHPRILKCYCWFFSDTGNLERPQSTRSWQMMSQFLRRERRQILISLQCLVKGYSGSYWKTYQRQYSHWP